LSRDQLEFIVRCDAGIDEQKGNHGNKRRAKIDQKRRQSGEGLKDHLDAPRESPVKVARSVGRRTPTAGSIQRKNPPFAPDPVGGGSFPFIRKEVMACPPATPFRRRATWHKSGATISMPERK
jgi:hypothetical protein